MAIITKGKCDAKGCGIEFDVENGGFRVAVLPPFPMNQEDDMVRFAVGRIKVEKTIDYDKVVCGDECLHKVIRDACDQYLGATVGDAHRMDTEILKKLESAQIDQVNPHENISCGYDEI